MYYVFLNEELRIGNINDLCQMKDYGVKAL